MLSDVPASLQELRDVGEWLLCCVLLLSMGGVGTRAKERGIELHQQPINDPDRDGYVELATRWRIIGDEGSVVNWAELWDDFATWKKNTQRTPVIHVHLHWSVNIYETSFACGHITDRYRFFPAVKRVPAMWGEKEPSLGGHLTMYIEATASDAVSIKWTGDMIAFAERLDAEGVRGAMCHQNTYVRILRDIDATAAASERVQKILETCFHSHAMIARVEHPHPDSNTPAFAFVEALRGASCLHFVDE